MLAFVSEHSHGQSPCLIEATEEQQDELEAMKAIFMDDVLECKLSPPSILIAIRDTCAGPDVALSVKLPVGYPDSELPLVKVLGLPRDLVAACQAGLHAEAEASSGSAMLFQLVNFVREWVEANPPGGGCVQGCGAAGSQAQASDGAEEHCDVSISAYLVRGEDEEETLGAQVVQEMIDAATDEAARWESVQGATTAAGGRVVAPNCTPRAPNARSLSLPLPPLRDNAPRDRHWH